MGEPTLVVAFGQLEAIEAALTEAHETLGKDVEHVRGEVARTLSGWDTATASRQAQLAFDHSLGTWAADLCDALDRIRLALATVRQEAHAAEVRNVAILD